MTSVQPVLFHLGKCRTDVRVTLDALLQSRAPRRGLGRTDDQRLGASTEHSMGPARMRVRSSSEQVSQAHREAHKRRDRKSVV